MGLRPVAVPDGGWALEQVGYHLGADARPAPTTGQRCRPSPGRRGWRRAGRWSDDGGGRGGACWGFDFWARWDRGWEAVDPGPGQYRPTYGALEGHLALVRGHYGTDLPVYILETGWIHPNDMRDPGRTPYQEMSFIMNAFSLWYRANAEPLNIAGAAWALGYGTARPLGSWSGGPWPGNLFTCEPATCDAQLTQVGKDWRDL